MFYHYRKKHFEQDVKYNQHVILLLHFLNLNVIIYFFQFLILVFILFHRIKLIQSMKNMSKSNFNHTPMCCVFYY